MKKTCLIFTMAFGTAMAFAKPSVPVDSIPQGAKDFISANFEGGKATYAEEDNFEVSVVLDNGTTISFSKNGDWQKVKSRNKVELGILPPPVARTITEVSEGAQIVRVEKKYGNYDVKLSNKIKLLVKEDGALLEKKRSDWDATKIAKLPKKYVKHGAHKMKPDAKSGATFGNKAKPNPDFKPMHKHGNKMKPDAKSGATFGNKAKPNPGFKPWEKHGARPEEAGNGSYGKHIPPTNREAPIPVPRDPTLQAQ